jgi:hypothetical protein
MKTSLCRNVLLCLVSISAMSMSASAIASAGGTSSGGGDLCEDQFKVVRDDLKNWVNNGGPSGLSLPSSLTANQYSQGMLAQIDAAKIRCVGQGDAGFPVMINGTPKVCRFDINAGTKQITCDATKFMAIDPSNQYVLVHHEYAGLAGIEPPNGDDSNYGVSNQISGFLENVVTEKLVIKPGLSILDQVLQVKDMGPLHRTVEYIEIANFDPYTGNAGFFSSGRDSYDSGGDTFGKANYATLREALTDDATRLDIVELHADSPLPGTIDYQKLYLKEFQKLLYSPQLTMGLSDDEIDQMDLIFTEKKEAGKNIFLWIGLDSGKIIVQNCGGITGAPSTFVASGNTFAEAIRACIPTLKK